MFNVIYIGYIFYTNFEDVYAINNLGINEMYKLVFFLFLNKIQYIYNLYLQIIQRVNLLRVYTLLTGRGRLPIDSTLRSV